MVSKHHSLYLFQNLVAVCFLLTLLGGMRFESLYGLTVAVDMKVGKAFSISMKKWYII